MRRIKRQCSYILEDGTRCLRHKFNKNEIYCVFHREKKITPTPVKTKEFVDYKKYIVSPEWKEKARQARRRAGNRCQLCNRSGKEILLHVHHRTYDRLGDESPMDLTVLCEECHRLFEFTSSHRPRDN